jgi:hypothetical protein
MVVVAEAMVGDFLLLHALSSLAMDVVGVATVDDSHARVLLALVLVIAVDDAPS